MILLNPVILSVVIMSCLCLLGLNMILALIVAALIAGTIAGIPLVKIINLFINGMGGNTEVAFSYILLGGFAAAIHKTGLATVSSNSIAKIVKGKAIPFILFIAFISTFPQNLIPIHIAFIPIIIPPILYLMNKLRVDRRAMACGLTFGLKFPYIVIPMGYGLIFHGIISNEMIANGVNIAKSSLWAVIFVPHHHVYCVNNN